jgi:hypothetical protein
MELEEFDNLLNRLTKGLSEIKSKNVTRETVFDALFMLYCDSHEMEYSLDLWDIEISYEEAFDSLSLFDFDILLNPIETELDFDRDILFQTKAKIKAAGYQIVIHRYDKDPFPSNPHGHILDQNLKLDLRNGKCYRIREEQTSIGKKKLIEIREKASLIYKGELPPLEV